MGGLPLLKLVFTTLLGGTLIAAATAQTMAPQTMAPMSTMTHKELQIKLLPQNNSGEAGTATLMDGEKGLIVKLRMTPTPDVDQPAHIHKGTCDKLDPKPTYPLKMVHAGESETTIPDVTIAMLEKAPFAINVHKSAAEAAIYVSCGNIVAPK
jgi:Cu/Zn superoxide dismutase